MRNRTINAFIVAFVLTLGATAFWSAGTEGRDGDDSANVIADNGATVGNAEDAKTTEAPKKKKGGGLFGIFKAPIKLVGRIFGGHDDNKLAPLSEKDVKNFESANVERINDARNPAPPATEEAGTAREHFERGRTYLDAGQLNEAIAELSRATALDPKMKQAHTLLAQAYDRKGLHENARKAFEQALDDQPDDPQTLNDLGYTLYLNGHYRAAVDKLKRAAKLAPTDARILNNLALAQCRLGKFDDAFKSFARAGGEFTGRLNTATLTERMGRDNEAIEQYEAARRIQRDSPAVLYRLADLYRRNGQSDKAEEARRALNGIKDDTVAER
jgi:tetratricopeptide (TPR) repeat protein